MFFFSFINKYKKTNNKNKNLFHFTFLKNLYRPWLYALSLIILASCGGGGGGGGGGVPKSPQSQQAPQVPPIPSDAPNPSRPGDNSDGRKERVFSGTRSIVHPLSAYENHPEYTAQVGLEVINAARAYIYDVSGKDVVNGFTDTGIDETHDEFPTGKIVLNDRSAYGGIIPSAQKLRHGTGVASVAAGQRGSGNGMHGVAYDAQIAMWTLHLDDQDYLNLDDNIFSRALNTLENNAGSGVINHSWGYDIAFNPSNAGAQKNLIAADFPQSIQLMSESDAVHVFSAGNRGESEVTITAAFAMLFPELRDKVVIAVAVDSNGVIGDTSNHCGHAKDLCLAAPGGYNDKAEYVVAAYPGGSYRPVLGTSFAAPHVSGAIAILIDLFDGQMTTDELIDRLLLTANKSGRYADADIYGQGLLDLERAINPVGVNYVPIGGGRRIRVDDSQFDFSAFGQAVDAKLREKAVIIIDSLGAPFKVPLSVFDNSDDPDFLIKEISPSEKFITHAGKRTVTGMAPISQGQINGLTLQGWQNEPQSVLGLVPMTGQDGVARSMLSTPYLQFAGYGSVGQVIGENWQVTGFNSWQDESYNSLNNQERNAGGVVSAFQKNLNGTYLGFQGGLMIEDKALLGTQGKGAFQLSGDGRTMFSGVGVTRHIGQGWYGAASAYRGHSETVKSDKSFLFGGVDNLETSAYEMVIWKNFKTKLAQLRLTQPVRNEKGDLHFNLPVRRNPNGAILFDRQVLPVSKKAREIQTMMSLRSLSATKYWFMDMKLRINPDHDANANTQWGMNGGVRLEF